MPDFTSANDASRADIGALVLALAPVDLDRTVEGGWTVAMIFGHLTFWERFVEQRWRHALANGLDLPIVLPSDLQDFINGALEPILAAVPGPAAIEQLQDAAESTDALIASLPPVNVDAARSAGLDRLLDRSLHRAEHLVQIRRALEASQGGSAG